MKYRIITYYPSIYTERPHWYKIQRKYKWWPFWIDVDIEIELEDAKKSIEELKNPQSKIPKVVYEE